jgi:hypothetical protein
MKWDAAERIMERAVERGLAKRNIEGEAAGKLCGWKGLFHALVCRGDPLPYRTDQKSRQMPQRSPLHVAHLLFFLNHQFRHRRAQQQDSADQGSRTRLPFLYRLPLLDSLPLRQARPSPLSAINPSLPLIFPTGIPEYPVFHSAAARVAGTAIHHGKVAS